MPRTRTHSSLRTAVVWAVLQAELDARTGPARILDVGGGTGGFAVPLAEAGHIVTVVDASPDALAALARRAAEQGVADRITARQGDADDLPTLAEPDTVDLVLCHSVLEVVDTPARTLAAVARVLRPGGCASVLVANHTAAVLARAVTGHFGAARALLDHPEGAAPTGHGPGAAEPRRRFDPATLTALVTAAGLTAERWHGVRVVADLVPGVLLDNTPGDAGTLLDLELALAERSPYWELATQLHVLARR